jgi:hypothetical protein
MLNGAVPTVKLNVNTVLVPLHIELVPEIEPWGVGLTVTISVVCDEQPLLVPVIV